MADILQQILTAKRDEVAKARAARPLDLVRREAESAAPALDFHAALADRSRGPRIIAECKKKSPSRGIMVADYDAVKLAKAYERGGAAAISVLTDEAFFGGTLADLRAVRESVRLPIIRKDFVIDAYQIYEARAAGADSFLLLAGPLDTDTLERFLAIGRSLGMEPLIESHSAAELATARATQGTIFGINNRDLKSFAIDMKHATELLAEVMRGAPPGAQRVAVCESGIKTRRDIENMGSVGYNAFLIGESLAISPDPEAQVRHLLSRDDRSVGQ